MKRTAKTYPPGAWRCPACYSAFDSYDNYDSHRRITHGRDGHGVLVAAISPSFAVTPTIEERLARLEERVRQLERARGE